MAESEWRRRCRPAIAAALAGMPAHWPRAMCERGLRGLYPFGPRANHPYAMWRREVRAQLDARFAHVRPPDPAARRPDVRLAIDGVRCRFCPPAGGPCLACLPDRRRWKALGGEAQREWMRLRAAAIAGEEGGDAACRDWSEEHMGGLPVGGEGP
jgi:hypothetical protein